MTSETILWIYIAFLMLGGLMGYIKARSKASLAASTAFAIPLALCALDIINPDWIADVILGILVLFFYMRFAKSKRFMPGGLMLGLSVVAIVLRLSIR